jgi:CarboxypepD_reg-like domain
MAILKGKIPIKKILQLILKHEQINFATINTFMPNNLFLSNNIFFESPYFKFIKVYLLFFALSIFSTQIFSQNTGFIEGVLADELKKPIEFANVYVLSLQKSTTSDKNGYYKLELPANVQLLVEISHASYAKKSESIKLKVGETIKIAPVFKIKEITEINVQDESVRNNPMLPIQIKEADLNPGINKGIETFIRGGLGVVNNNELGSAYSVRGGSFEENLVYVNDIEVYRPFLARSGQQEGLSFANVDMISNVQFSAGGFEARYGDKLSSVLDIKYKKPKEFGGSTSIGLLGGDVSIEGTSKNYRFTHISGFRYNSNKYILGSLDVKGDYRPAFTDFQTFLTYDITEKLQLSFLGNYSKNKYNFVPENRETNFGTIQQAIRFTVFYEGQEITSFETKFGALSLDYKPNDKTLLKFTGSVFNTYEKETFDILGEFFLNELGNDLGTEEFGEVVANIGVGGFLQHARNYLEATVVTFSHKGYFESKNKYLQWGIDYKKEIINDKISEWNLIDSAGYSVPVFPLNEITLQNVVKSKNELFNDKASAYLQNSWNWKVKNSNLALTAGVRGTYWSFSEELFASPRANIAYKPNWERVKNDSTVVKKDVVFKFSTGVYNQTPFYRELRDFNGNINNNLVSQRSIHFVIGADVNFKMWKRPFKFITEAYYKKLDRLVPYEVDNVRLRYYATNNSKGYATGLDFKINGEFIPGLESWFNMSILQTRENIEDDFFYNYYNSNGALLNNGDDIRNNIAVDSTLQKPGFIPRPTDQTVSFSLYFQDELPKFPMYKVNLSLIYGTGLPYGPPSLERYKDIYRLPDYRRVDIGFSRQLVNKPTAERKDNFLKNVKQAYISLEVFNLLGINNTISYLWIKDASGIQYAIPNYLTSRRINLKFSCRF